MLAVEFRFCDQLKAVLVSLISRLHTKTLQWIFKNFPHKIKQTHELNLNFFKARNFSLTFAGVSFENINCKGNNFDNVQLSVTCNQCMCCFRLVSSADESGRAMMLRGTKDSGLRFPFSVPSQRISSNIQHYLPTLFFHQLLHKNTYKALLPPESLVLRIQKDCANKICTSLSTWEHREEGRSKESSSILFYLFIDSINTWISCQNRRGETSKPDISLRWDLITNRVSSFFPFFTVSSLLKHFIEFLLCAEGNSCIKGKFLKIANPRHNNRHSPLFIKTHGKWHEARNHRQLPHHIHCIHLQFFPL